MLGGKGIEFKPLTNAIDTRRVLRTNRDSRNGGAF
jgi:hypothetical protein